MTRCVLKTRVSHRIGTLTPHFLIVWTSTMPEKSSNSLNHLLANLPGPSSADSRRDSSMNVDFTHTDNAAAQQTTMTADSAADPRLQGLIDRISHMTAGGVSEKPLSHLTLSQPYQDRSDVERPDASTIATEWTAEGGHPSDAFLPIEPKSLREAELTDSEVEALILKYLLARGSAPGHTIAEQLRLPFVLIEVLLRELKDDRLLGHKRSAPMNDYVYEMTDLGRERAREHKKYCRYFGAAPVSLKDYIHSVRTQSLEHQSPSPGDLKRAFHDLLITPAMLDRLGPAINSGRGLFLYGNPGNGKTSIAERATATFGEFIWIPRTIGIDGEIIRLFDPSHHFEVALENSDGLLHKRKVDHRWVRVRRPTIVTGGELTMENLEVTLNTTTGISEAPLQLKANCGTLLIDDFGRQRMNVDELLNRCILPLEKRYDFLNLANGKQIQVPFDELIIFATNLEPRDLVDEAFLRRIPYKIEVVDPTEREFHGLFRMLCPKLGFTYQREAIDYLINKHFKEAGRAMRYCHVRDLLMQIRNACRYHKREPMLTAEYFDLAINNYFAVM